MTASGKHRLGGRLRNMVRHGRIQGREKHGGGIIYGTIGFRAMGSRSLTIASPDPPPKATAARSMEENCFGVVGEFRRSRLRVQHTASGESEEHELCTLDVLVTQNMVPSAQKRPFLQGHWIAAVSLGAYFIPPAPYKYLVYVPFELFLPVLHRELRFCSLIPPITCFDPVYMTLASWSLIELDRDTLHTRLGSSHECHSGGGRCAFALVSCMPVRLALHGLISVESHRLRLLLLLIMIEARASRVRALPDEPS
uniref:Uncharacterized protein n=1 Tax=Ananas comosus var. bracteatus TaxID=296719 RepID=A0A6V7NT86_ANACO|nr:unnamed protein product [Ananas comosus var. bracteatus]